MVGWLSEHLFLRVQHMLRSESCVLFQRREQKFQEDRTNLSSPAARCDSCVYWRRARNHLCMCSGTTRLGWSTMTWAVGSGSDMGAISANWSWPKHISTILGTTPACHPTHIQPASVSTYWTVGYLHQNHIRVIHFFRSIHNKNKPVVERGTVPLTLKFK